MRGLFNLTLKHKIEFYEMSVKEINSEWIKKVGPIDTIIHLAATTDAAGNFNKRNEIIFGSVCISFLIPINE